jgi:hypothetical protein
MDCHGNVLIADYKTKHEGIKKIYKDTYKELCQLRSSNQKYVTHGKLKGIEEILIELNLYSEGQFDYWKWQVKEELIKK